MIVCPFFVPQMRQDQTQLLRLPGQTRAYANEKGELGTVQIWYIQWTQKHGYIEDLADKFDIVFYTQTGSAQMHFVHRYHIVLLRGFMNTNAFPPLLP